MKVQASLISPEVYRSSCCDLSLELKRKHFFFCRRWCLPSCQQFLTVQTTEVQSLWGTLGNLLRTPVFLLLWFFFTFTFIYVRRVHHKEKWRMRRSDMAFRQNWYKNQNKEKLNIYCGLNSCPHMIPCITSYCIKLYRGIKCIKYNYGLSFGYCREFYLAHYSNW